MKNVVINSIALICCSSLLFLASCEKENIDETETVVTDPQGNGGDEFDCPGLGNVGDPCQGGWGTVSADCDCEENLEEFDCAELLSNVGDTCNLPFGVPGTVNEDCECAEVQEYCADLAGFPGEQCTLISGTGLIYDGVITEDCDCLIDSPEYCQDLTGADPDFSSGFIGDECLTLSNLQGIITSECDCVENDQTELDCPGLNGNVGDPCQGGWGIITEDCDCVEIVEPIECSGVDLLAEWFEDQLAENGTILLIGDECYDYNNNLGTVEENCVCIAN